jgi:hemin uptake protein HemP
MDSQKTNQKPAAPRTTDPSHLPVFDSRTLFGSAVQVLIDHGEERYVLRRTRHGKLLLTK